ncbi:MAG: tRNA (adenosine(37)-N6)-dimethylallyltransferase MiaA [Thermoanaerobaculia bacterium]
MTSAIAIVGATATGKSQLAVELAIRLGGEIVNADAFQVYRGLDIGTAKPDSGARAAVAHHLIDILEPTETFSAGRFARRAAAAIADIVARGRVAIVAGGTGFYVRALAEGLAPLPTVPPELRERLAARCAREGAPALHVELASVDPESAARIAPRDRHRVLRALEVWLASGETLSSWHRRAPATPNAPTLRKIGLTLPRAVLYDRIESRVASMLERGWLDEIRGLLAAGVPPAAPAFRAIGYRSMIEYLSHGRDLESATREAVVATRRYAKRQETWFRRDRDIEWLEARDRERALEAALRHAGARSGESA